MVVIRLSRGGAKKRPFYFLVVANSRSARDGKYIEELGFYNPIAKGGEVPVRINMERVKHWQTQGAQLTERVAKLLKDYVNTAQDANAGKE
jgi:small subunit ribosomal protein S16